MIHFNGRKEKSEVKDVLESANFHCHLVVIVALKVCPILE